MATHKSLKWSKQEEMPHELKEKKSLDNLVKNIFKHNKNDANNITLIVNVQRYYFNGKK